MKTPFLGPFSVSRSPNLSDNQLINLYPTLVDTKDGKEVGAFYMTPGLTLLATLGRGPVRGFNVMGSTLYAVSGNQLFAVTTGYIASVIGTLNTASGAVSMINNGLQVAIFDGINGYVVQPGNVFAVIVLPFTKPQTASYQDSFGLVNEGGTNNWYQSNSFDLATWAPLNFSIADAQPNPIVSVNEIHREQWLFKNNGIEIWVDAGLPGFAFQRLEGVYVECGCAAAFSIAKAGEHFIFLSEDDQGARTIRITNGYGVPDRISTHSVESIIQGYATVSDAIAYCYQQLGNLFYVITFPSANATWCYDIGTSAQAGIPMWHRRAAFLNGQFSRHQSNCYIYFNSQAVVGDFSNGNLYALDTSSPTDNGVLRKWVRSWRALAKPVMEPVAFSSLQIDMQTGVGVNAGTNPLVVLRWTDDGGHNWSNELFAPAGKTGQTAKRVLFRRLGATRRDTGLDRIWELSSTDAFGVNLMGAEQR